MSSTGKKSPPRRAFFALGGLFGFDLIRSLLRDQLWLIRWPLLRNVLSSESDTLEARARLTSYSALESGGLPEPGALRVTSGRAETRAGLNSRLEAVSGA